MATAGTPSHHHTRPPIRKDRPDCPFYGFTSYFGFMIDTGGNGCGLTGEHKPCLMEMKNEKPEWDDCSYKNIFSEEQLLSLCSETRIIPREWQPTHGNWDGVSMQEWIEALLNR